MFCVLRNCINMLRESAGELVVCKGVTKKRVLQMFEIARHLTVFFFLAVPTRVPFFFSSFHSKQLAKISPDQVSYNRLLYSR